MLTTPSAATIRRDMLPPLMVSFTPGLQDLLWRLLSCQSALSAYWQTEEAVRQVRTGLRAGRSGVPQWLLSGPAGEDVHA